MSIIILHDHVEDGYPWSQIGASGLKEGKSEKIGNEMEFSEHRHATIVNDVETVAQQEILHTRETI